MHQSLNSAALKTIETAERVQSGACKIEIGVSQDVDMQDFRNWWKANVKESRYWGGGPDGAWSGTSR